MIEMRLGHRNSVIATFWNGLVSTYKVQRRNIWTCWRGHHETYANQTIMVARMGMTEDLSTPRIRTEGTAPDILTKLVTNTVMQTNIVIQRLLPAINVSISHFVNSCHDEHSQSCRRGKPLMRCSLCDFQRTCDPWAPLHLDERGRKTVISHPSLSLRDSARPYNQQKNTSFCGSLAVCWRSVHYSRGQRECEREVEKYCQHVVGISLCISICSQIALGRD